MDTMKAEWEDPLVIEACLSPLRIFGEPQVFTNSELIAEAKQCLGAGAGIIHHHHDYAQDMAGTAAEMIALHRGVIEDFPHALLYGDYVKGSTLDEQMSHFPVVADAGALTMMAVDPGFALVGGIDDEGRPFTYNKVGGSYEDANRLCELAVGWRVPLSIGVYEPSMLRWAVVQAQRGALPKGSLLKFYLASYCDFFTPGKRAMNQGLPPTEKAVDVLVEMIEGSGLAWQVSVLGGVIHEMPLARYVIERGGHIRTGIEDAAGLTDTTNAECVSAIANIACQVGRPIAEGADTLPSLIGRSPVVA